MEISTSEDTEDTRRNQPVTSVTMVNLTIPEFWGTPKKDARRFLRIIDLNFMAQTQFTGKDLNAAKCLVLEDKCKRVAEAWVSRQRDFQKKNWDALKIAFVERFPLQAQSNVMQKILNRLFKLKQNNRSYAEYFEEVRKIEKDLPREIANIIPTRLIQDLDDEILRMLIEDIMS